jgi:hypothetical protein
VSTVKNTSFSYSKNDLNNMCLNLFQQRYNKEYNFVKFYIIRKGNQFLSTYWQKYVLKDLVDIQWQRLLEKFSKMLGYFTRIVKLV